MSGFPNPLVAGDFYRRMQVLHTLEQHHESNRICTH